MFRPVFDDQPRCWKTYQSRGKYVFDVWKEDVIGPIDWKNPVELVIGIPSVLFSVLDFITTYRDTFNRNCALYLKETGATQ